MTSESVCQSMITLSLDLQDLNGSNFFQPDSLRFARFRFSSSRKSSATWFFSFHYRHELHPHNWCFVFRTSIEVIMYFLFSISLEDSPTHQLDRVLHNNSRFSSHILNAHSHCYLSSHESKETETEGTESHMVLFLLSSFFCKKSKTQHELLEEEGADAWQYPRREKWVSACSERRVFSSLKRSQTSHSQRTRRWHWDRQRRGGDISYPSVSSFLLPSLSPYRDLILRSPVECEKEIQLIVLIFFTSCFLILMFSCSHVLAQLVFFLSTFIHKRDESSLMYKGFVGEFCSSSIIHAHARLPLIFTERKIEGFMKINLSFSSTWHDGLAFVTLSRYIWKTLNHKSRQYCCSLHQQNGNFIGMVHNNLWSSDSDDRISHYHWNWKEKVICHRPEC